MARRIIALIPFPSPGVGERTRKNTIKIVCGGGREGAIFGGESRQVADAAAGKKGAERENRRVIDSLHLLSSKQESGIEGGRRPSFLGAPCVHTFHKLSFEIAVFPSFMNFKPVGLSFFTSSRFPNQPDGLFLLRNVTCPFVPPPYIAICHPTTHRRKHATNSWPRARIGPRANTTDSRNNKSEKGVLFWFLDITEAPHSP